MRVGYEALKPQLTQPAQVCARHILVEDEAQAVQLAEAIRGGTDFSVLAAAVSIDQGSAASGGELGCFAMGMMVAEFEGAAFAA
ncbi:MAG: peptidylprolyl isomerase, partial [Thiobacillus sp.]